MSFTENRELFPGVRFRTCREPLKFEKVIGGRSAASGGGKALGHGTAQREPAPMGA